MLMPTLKVMPFSFFTVKYRMSFCSSWEVGKKVHWAIYTFKGHEGSHILTINKII